MKSLDSRTVLALLFAVASLSPVVGAQSTSSAPKTPQAQPSAAAPGSVVVLASTTSETA
jgi:hypothetical protein